MDIKDQILEIVHSSKSIGSYDLAQKLNLEEAFVIMQVQQIIEHDKLMIVRRRGYGPSEYELSIMPNYAGIVKSFLATGGFTRIHHENQQAQERKIILETLELGAKQKSIEAANSQIDYNKNSLLWSKIAIAISIIATVIAFCALYRS